MMKAGFTLIELLITLIIIGILSTLAIPIYLDYAEKARAAEAINLINVLRTAENLYKVEHGEYYHGSYTETLPDGSGVVHSNDFSILNIGYVPTTDADAVSAGQYWFYKWEFISYTIPIPTPSLGDYYSVSAHRSTLKGGLNTQYISYQWSDNNGAQWGGSHPGVPKNN